MKRFASALLALILVLSLSVCAFAATEPDATLRISGSVQGQTATVQVFLTAEDVTNGKIQVCYDKNLATLVNAIPANRGALYSVNTRTAGVVTLAWIGSSYPASEVVVLTLIFQVAGNETFRCSAAATELYRSGTALDLDNASDELSLSLAKPVTYTLTVNWVDEEGSALAPTLFQPKSKGASYTTELKSFEGYTFVGLAPDSDDVSGTMNGHKSVTYVYVKDVVTPVDPDPVDPDPVEPDPVEPECPFTDIDNHWAKQYILTAYQAGLVNGTTDTTFAPEVKLSRASFVTLLYRLNGSPAAEGDLPFTDVGSTWFTDAVTWGYTNGVVTGKSATTFDPNGQITRQELAVMLMRYAKLTGMDVSASNSLEGYADTDLVAGWAKEAMQWAVAEGFITGRSGNLLAPTEVCSRAEAATILVRFAGL